MGLEWPEFDADNSDEMRKSEPFEELLTVPSVFTAPVMLGIRFIPLDQQMLRQQIPRRGLLQSVRLPFLNCTKRFRIWADSSGAEAAHCRISEWSQTPRVLNPLFHASSGLLLPAYQNLRIEIESPQGIENMDLAERINEGRAIGCITVAVEVIHVRVHQGQDPLGGWQTSIVH